MIPDSVAMAALQDQPVRTEMNEGIETARLGANHGLNQPVRNEKTEAFPQRFNRLTVATKCPGRRTDMDFGIRTAFIEAASKNIPVVRRVKGSEPIQNRSPQSIVPHQAPATVSSGESLIFRIETPNAKGRVKQVDRVPTRTETTEVVPGQTTPEDRVYRKSTRSPGPNRADSFDNPGIHLVDRETKPPLGRTTVRSSKRLIAGYSSTDLRRHIISDSVPVKPTGPISA